MPLAAQPLPWAKWALRLIGPGWDIVTGLFEALGTDPPEDLEWRRLQIVFTRSTPSGTNEDAAICSFDFVNMTDGAVDTSWTTGDYEAMEALLDTFVNAVRGSMNNAHTVSQYRWYRARFNPLSVGAAFPAAGPPERITSRSLTGTAGSGSTLPFQVALSVTEITSSPRHWGRFYWPGLAKSTVDDFGRWTSGVRSAFANAIEALYEDAADADFFPVVPVTQVAKTPARGLLGVSSVQVDDIPDVQRRRRASQAAARNILP